MIYIVTGESEGGKMYMANVVSTNEHNARIGGKVQFNTADLDVKWETLKVQKHPVQPW